MIKYIVYLLIDPLTRKVKYVGVTTNLAKRILAHKHDSRSNPQKSRWAKSCNPIVEIVEETTNPVRAFRQEWCLIRRFRNAEFDIFNKADGGRSNRGFKLSESTKRLMSETRKGKLNGFYGKTHSLKTRRHISKLHAISVCDEVGNVYSSITEAGRVLGVHKQNIVRVLKKRCKSTGGHKFRYANEI